MLQASIVKMYAMMWDSLQQCEIKRRSAEQCETLRNNESGVQQCKRMRNNAKYCELD